MNRYLFIIVSLGSLAGCSSQPEEAEDASVHGSRPPDAGEVDVDAAPRVPCPIGDLGQDPELELFQLQTNFTRVPLGATVELHNPYTDPSLQGGQSLRVGVRARNLDCNLTQTTALRDLCDGDLIALEVRPMMLVEDEDGWGTPYSLATQFSYSDLSVCPKQGQSRDMESEPYSLTVVIEDADGRSAETTVEVMPACVAGEGYADCLCECDRDYFSGGCTADLPGPTACPY